MTIDELVAEVDRLCQARAVTTAEVDRRIAAVQAELKALDAERATLLEPFRHELETLQAVLRMRVIAETLPTVQGHSFTCRRTEKVQWDDAGLEAYAKEQPSVMQFRKVVPSTTWRWK